MNNILTFILVLPAAYLIGSFPTSYIMTKFLKGVDIRESGSKNAGATNVFRVVGKLPGIITLIVDIAKGVLVVTVLSGISYRSVTCMGYDLYRLLIGFTAICGHIWPVWLGFRGGKGVATTIGVAAACAPGIFLPAILVWLIVFIFTSYVSLASIISFISFPVIAAIVNSPAYLIVFSVIICLIVVYKHYPNIDRLLKGKESKTKVFKFKI